MKIRNNLLIINLSLLIILTGITVYIFNALTLSLLVSFFIAEVFAPYLNKLEEWGVHRIIGAAILYTVLALIFLAFIQYINKFYDDLVLNSAAMDKVEEIALSIPYLSKSPELVNNLSANIVSFVKNNIGLILENILSFFGWAGFVAFTSFIMLINKHEIKKTIIDMVPNRYFETGLAISYAVEKEVSNYLNMQIARWLIVTIATSFFLFLFDMKYPFLLGITVGFLNIFPFIGPVIGMGVLFLVEKIAMDSFSLTVSAYLLINVGIVQLVDNFVLQPFLLSKGSQIGPLTVLVAVFAGSKVFGVLGMIIAIPLASIIVFTYREIRSGYY